MLNILPAAPYLIAYAGAAVLLSATPGPDMALFLQRTLSGGRAHGLAAMGGAMTGILVHTMAAAFGLSALIAASASLYGAVRVAGALYLLWLAWNALRHGSALNVGPGGAPAKSLGSTFATGVLINVTNPKIVLFFVTFLPQFIAPDDSSPAGKFVALGILYVLISSLVNGAIILAAGGFLAALRRHPRRLRLFDYALAALMGGFAARLLASSGGRP